MTRGYSKWPSVLSLALLVAAVALVGFGSFVTSVAYAYDSGSTFTTTSANVAFPTAPSERTPTESSPAILVAFRGFSATEDTAGTIRNVNALSGTMNCVNCVIAGDATLSGAAASALDSGGPQAISILERQFGGRFEAVSGRAEIEQILESQGSGARGIVYGARSGGQAGHVFNVVNQGGTVRFLDPQIGGPASFEGYPGFRYLQTNVP